MATTEDRYQPGTHPSLPPPITAAGQIGWLRANLFSSPLNVLLTLLSVALLIFILPPLIQWAFLDATCYLRAQVLDNRHRFAERLLRLREAI